MVSKFLAIGDKTEITLKRNGKSVKKSFATQIVDFDSENPNRFIINCPISYGKIILLPIKEVYTLVFYTKSSVVSCDCNVIEHLKKDDIHNTLMEAVSDFDKTQRRQFFRFACLIPFRFIKLDMNNENFAQEQNVTMQEGIVKDLGGGGIRFVSNDGLETDDFVQVVLPVKDEMIIAVGKVILKTPVVADASKYKFEYRLKFNAIDRADQDKIVRYVLSEQRKFLQKTGFIKNQL